MFKRKTLPTLLEDFENNLCLAKCRDRTNNYTPELDRLDVRTKC